MEPQICVRSAITRSIIAMACLHREGTVLIVCCPAIQDAERATPGTYIVSFEIIS